MMIVENVLEMIMIVENVPEGTRCTARVNRDGRMFCKCCSKSTLACPVCKLSTAIPLLVLWKKRLHPYPPTRPSAALHAAMLANAGKFHGCIECGVEVEFGTFQRY